MGDDRRWRRLRIHPLHVRIAKAAFIMAFFTLLIKLVSLGKEVAIAWRFGRGIEVDAYNLALTLASWLPTTIVSVMNMVLVPVLVRMRSADGIKRMHFLSELNGLALWVGCGGILFVLFTGYWVMPWFMSLYGEYGRELSFRMIVSMAPISLTTMFAAIYTMRLQAANDHRYALTEGLPALVIIALFFVYQVPDYSLLIVGTLFGAVLQTILLGQLTRQNNFDMVGLHWRMRSAEWPFILRSVLIMGIGQLIMSISVPIDQFFAAKSGIGGVATLSYANKLTAFIMMLGATVISRVTLPVFSEVNVDEKLGEVYQVAMRWAALMVVCGLVVALFFVIYATEIVELLFQRGAFGEVDARVVAKIFRLTLLQLPFYFALLVYSALLASRQVYRLYVLSALLFIIIKMPIMIFFSAEYRLDAIVLSNGIAYIGSFLLLSFVLIKNRGLLVGEGGGKTI